MKTLRYHAKQDILYRTRARFPVVSAGRGSGKSLIAKRKVTRYLSIRVPGCFQPMYFYGLPTTQQAKRVAWESLKDMLPTEWHRKGSKTFYESERIIKTKFNSELHVVGLDAPQRIEGNQWCGGVLDECSDQKPKVFDLTIRPALTDYKGWCARIGVPKRYGTGASDFKAAFDAALQNPTQDDIALHWESASIVDPQELAGIMLRLDIRDFNEQYRASWEQISGAIFYAYAAQNLNTSVVYRPDKRIVVGSDFNVDPMCWTLGHISDDGNKLQIFDEMAIRNTNTEECLNLLHTRFPQHIGWDFFGDASGKARKTSANKSDYIQILNDERFKDKQVYYLKANPPIKDRFATCNAMLCNAVGQRRLEINPCCKRLILDLEHRSYKVDSNEPNDSGDMGHMSDALGYIIYRKWPLRVITNTISRVITRNA